MADSSADFKEAAEGKKVASKIDWNVPDQIRVYREKIGDWVWVDDRPVPSLL